jgi:hypothetical protein
MKKILIIISLLFPFAALLGQQSWERLISAKMPDLPMDCALYQIASYGQADREDALRKAIGMNLIVKEDRFYVELVKGESVEDKMDETYLRSLPAELTTRWKNRASAWVSLDQLLPLAQNLAADYHLHAVYYPHHDNQGPGQMTSDSYIANGLDGSGINVAIFDGGFDSLTEARAQMAAPQAGNTTVYNNTGNPLESDGRHGTGCVESVFDHAPGANYFICKIYSVSDMGDAVDWCIDQGVDVISHSLSRYNLGWNDNSGGACAAVQDATNAGMLFFTSAGNRNGTHWQGNWSDPDGDDNHNWTATDEANNFTVVDDGSVSIYLQWDASPGTDCYDLFLFDDATDAVLASSTSGSNYESIGWTNTSGATMNVYLAVVDGGASSNPEFEIFNHDNGAGNFQYSSTQGSTTSPSNSTQPNCISVAAVPWINYSSPAGSNVIAGYSSRGPSNDGAMAPDIASTTNTTTVAYNGGFGGTSCATPNAAGLAAAFWSAHPGVSADGIRAILFRKAQLYNDWGASGPDNTYGNGGLELYDFVPNTVYIHSYSPAQPANQQPYPGPQEANDHEPDDAHAVFLGGAFLVPPVPGVIEMDRPAVYQSLIEDTSVE